MNKLLCVVTLLLYVAAGCNAPPPPQKAPRPVSVMGLATSDPGRLERITGSVASWKTDQLGFEVDGRVQFVVEAESDIAGHVYDQDGKLLSQGTLLARLDPTRYELAIESARSEIAVAEKQREAAQIQYERVIPAEIEAAIAERDLAKTEFDRTTRLVTTGAVSEREVEVWVSKLRKAEASLLQLAANKQAKASEVASIDAKIRDLQQNEKEAIRDLEDCRLKSQFAGQVAEVHVIPGSFVNRGQPAVTVQMMDPIQVEVEVAAATARQLNHLEEVNVYVPQPSGSMLRRLSFIHMIDPVADPQTRTFTVTLMMRNEKVRLPLPEELQGQAIARCTSVRRLIKDIPGLAQGLFVGEGMMEKDQDGCFVWKILNRRIGSFTAGADRILKVQKVRVTPGQVRVSFLGMANLREITIANNAEFNPDTDMIAGRVTPPDGEDAWNGDTLLFDVDRWLVRPGDLVGVDQRGASLPPGIYVPLDAIREKSGSHFVFAVEQSADGDVARQLPVTVHENVDTLRRIESASDQTLALGTKIVVEGTAFLVDGERINVARELPPER